MKNKDNVVKCLLLVILAIVIIIAIYHFSPYLEYILHSEQTNENTDSELRELYSFSITIISVIVSVVIGVITILQSKKHKDEDDDTNSLFLGLQTSIKELVNSNIEINKSLLLIQKSLFEPRLSDVQIKYDCPLPFARGKIDYIENTNAFIFSNWDDRYDLNNPTEPWNKYKYIAINLFNDGEKTIVSYKIQWVEIEREDELECWYGNETDIPPHTGAWMTLAIADDKFSIIDDMLKEGKEVVIKSTFKNSLGDDYVTRCKLGCDSSVTPSGVYIIDVNTQKMKC